MKKYYFKFFSFGQFAADTLYHLKQHEIYAPSIEKLNDPFENIWVRLKENQFDNVNNEFQKRISDKNGVFCMCSSDNEEFPLAFQSI